MEEKEHIHDVLIIGAGPCGLAAAARLRENTPSALFTDAEHARYHWIAKHSSHSNIKQKKGKVKHSQPTRSQRQYDILVLDSCHEGWMGEWDRLFKTLGISHLRSPAFFHVDPADRDGLLEFAHVNACGQELREIKNCVGKEMSKHRKKSQRIRERNRRTEPEIDERDRKDYYSPSTGLFSAHCGNLIERYGLHGLVQKATVFDIDYVPAPALESYDNIFKVTTAQGIFRARTVVLAVGSCRPVPQLHLQTDSNREVILQAYSCQEMLKLPNVCHSHDIRSFPDQQTQTKIDLGIQANVLVVGGGLTAAQLADLALQRGVTHVTLLTRSNLKVKPFDVDLSWLGKFQNHEKAIFWSADTDDDRLTALLTARNGGSITPSYSTILQTHQRANRLTIHTNHTLTTATYDPSTSTSTITTTPPCPSLSTTHFDYIYLATGTPADIAAVPFLQTLRTRFPVTSCGGLPCLTNELAWREEVPLFVTGRLAGLRLGPGAGNLEGARAGAERVAWGVGEWLGRGDAEGEGGGMDEGDGGDMKSYVEGVGSRFRCLA